jgi:myosin heavy subunit
MQTGENNHKNQKPLYIALGVAAVLLIVIAALYITQSVEMKEVVEEMTIEKNILTEEYQDLAMGYDSLESTSDTLNTMLERERQKVEHLIEEIKTIKATNASKIREYRKELGTLRGVLKSYVAQIDSLNRINEELKKENKEYQQRYSQIQNSYKELEDVKTELEDKVEIASRLETTNMRAEGLNARGRSTSRTSRIDKIEVCFTVKKNLTAPVGMKPFYIRLERPDGQILLRSRDDLFEYEGTEINYSAMREIEYGGEETEICIFYDADMGELMPGEYTTDIFADGANIGRFSFELK